MPSLRALHACAARALIVLTTVAPTATAPAQSAPQRAVVYDLVILAGRVIDPESRLDAIRNVGIRNGTIATITTNALKGRDTINATGLVVAPGFIDLHQH